MNWWALVQRMRLMRKILPVRVENDGWSEWLHPLPGFLMQCCDCGLVHELQTAIAESHDKGTVTNAGEDAEHVVIFRMRRASGSPRRTWLPKQNIDRWRDSDGTRSAETACPAPGPKPCQARVRKDIAQKGSQ
jgi:hypothetical protein